MMNNKFYNKYFSRFYHSYDEEKNLRFFYSIDMLGILKTFVAFPELLSKNSATEALVSAELLRMDIEYVSGHIRNVNSVGQHVATGVFVNPSKGVKHFTGFDPDVDARAIVKYRARLVMHDPTIRAMQGFSEALKKTFGRNRGRVKAIRYIMKSLFAQTDPKIMPLEFVKYGSRTPDALTDREIAKRLLNYVNSKLDGAMPSKKIHNNVQSELTEVHENKPFVPQSMLIVDYTFSDECIYNSLSEERPPLSFWPRPHDTSTDAPRPETKLSGESMMTVDYNTLHKRGEAMSSTINVFPKYSVPPLIHEQDFRVVKSESAAVLNTLMESGACLKPDVTIPKIKEFVQISIDSVVPMPEIEFLTGYSVDKERNQNITVPIWKSLSQLNLPNFHDRQYLLARIKDPNPNIINKYFFIRGNI